MVQTRESGAAAAQMGRMRAKGLTKLLGAHSLSEASNLVMYDGKRAVIKSCRPETSSIGITPTMEPTLDILLAAFEDKFGDIQVVRAFMSDVRKVMYDGVQRRTPLKMVRRADIERLGRPIARFKVREIELAGQ